MRQKGRGSTLELTSVLISAGREDVAGTVTISASVEVEEQRRRGVS